MKADLGMATFFESTPVKTGRKQISIIVTISVSNNEISNYRSEVKITFILVTWENVEYNIGNHFNESLFTVPYDGVYFFNANAIQHSTSEGIFYLSVNGTKMSVVKSVNAQQKGNIVLNKTLELKKNDKVTLDCGGHLYDLNKNTFFFEGKLIEKK